MTKYRLLLLLCCCCGNYNTTDRGEDGQWVIGCSRSSRDQRNIPVGIETAIISTAAAAEMPWQRTASWNRNMRSVMPSTPVGYDRWLLYWETLFLDVSHSAAVTYLLLWAVKIFHLTETETGIKILQLNFSLLVSITECAGIKSITNVFVIAFKKILIDTCRISEFCFWLVVSFYYIFL